MSEREVVIVDYARSAFGRLGGGLRDFAACEIGGEIIKGLVKKTGIMERAFVDSVIAGCAHGDSKTQLPVMLACTPACPTRPLPPLWKCSVVLPSWR